jgi:UDP-N-acetylglucosamine 2-epimerase (non-hydrolysing)
MRARPLTIATVVGTRPEAVKMAPVIRAIDARPGMRAFVVSTGQHREMLRQILEPFGIRPAVDLAVMRPRQTLNDVAATVLRGLDRVLVETPPDMLLVQGDTTTAFAAALAAFHRRVPVGHVEAGLRTWDTANPYPEEANRRLAAVVADVHWAPTPGSAANLRREGVPAERVLVTGNTVIDCLLEAVRRARGALARFLPLEALDGRRLILVTAHRRENWDAGLGELCAALRELVDRHDDVVVLFPVHLNPVVRDAVRPLLGGRERVVLVDPLPYWAFVDAMARAHFIVTDSGGVQEEAPSLGKPVLVVREKTERPEAVAAGGARLVGRDRDGIVAAARALLEDAAEYRRMSRKRNPYGDGRAAQRIVGSLAHFFGRGPAPWPFHPHQEDIVDHGLTTAAAQ